MTAIESNNVFIARQPILDSKRNIIAYELLFRSANSQQMNILDDMTATSEVLLNTINSIGINKVIGDKLGFVNMNETFFEEGIHESLDKDRFVLEILEHTKMSPELVEKLKQIAEKGYTLALDDFIFEDDMIEVFEPIFPLIKILKIDLMASDMNTLGKKLKFFKKYNVELLAEKVENQKDFEICKKLGFKYYQGYFFSKPEIMEGKRIDPNVMAVMDLARIARKPDSASELEKSFKSHPDITVNFLRFVNSADNAFRSNITSVRHALNLIGQQKLVRWLMLLMYAKAGGSNNNSSPLLITASARADLMESVMVQMGMEEEELLNKAFLTGILSLMDVVFHIEMPQLLKDLSIDEDICAAILNHEGRPGQLLLLAKAYERQDFEQMNAALDQLEIDQETFALAINQSFSKSEV